MRIRKLEIVADGIQKNGQPVTKAQLESVVRHYKSDARPPVTPGHPTKGSDQIAALGRASNLRTEAGSGDKSGKTVLVGEVIYTPEMETLEDSGKFEGFSAGIHPVPDKEGEWYMHHLAFLGQLPPAADTKTRDVVDLSDSDFCDDAIYLSADVGTQPGSGDNETGITMKKDELKTLLGDVVKEQLDGMGIKPNTPPVKKEGEQSKDGEPTKTDDDKSNSVVTAMQETLAGDRKETLTELADSREMSDELRKSVKVMIEGASAIELCASGDGNRYSQLKGMLSAMSEKKTVPATPSVWDKLTENLELADTGSAQKDNFDPEGW
ncbi:conserved hypothetical protein [Vibrio crassostreae]|uniref:Uncharacterized protein n=1 Tax=Vibrio crassostreae TaxID=246167 RepID=A0ABP1WUI8_9VIBR|nr:hypothetical protein [Vibrio crassostreae]CAK1994880.1 conserved hypothetical protein [Vibrio crassostreae]CAK2032340.1 conserved hypothetical protein [Vibrio crassostreae]CAK2087432.1 conserved hypothetical protein [Vibrio crassostreae]CAK2132178.1 conserved hypothetical protein [Vibrio crassostreae]CAK2134540.1 conserved hypothetical protein [Vibrio crassostreae]